MAYNSSNNYYSQQSPNYAQQKIDPSQKQAPIQGMMQDPWTGVYQQNPQFYQQYYQPQQQQSSAPQQQASPSLDLSGLMSNMQQQPPIDWASLINNLQLGLTNSLQGMTGQITNNLMNSFSGWLQPPATAPAPSQRTQPSTFSQPSNYNYSTIGQNYGQLFS